MKSEWPAAWLNRPSTRLSTWISIGGVPAIITGTWPWRRSFAPNTRTAFANLAEGQLIDWIDPETAEIRQMDGLQHIIIEHCAKQEGFLNEHTGLVEGVFRLLLANGNTPMTPEVLGSRLNRPADTILKTIAGARVYKGLRPYNA